jgi:hypothetical protein
MLTSTGGRWPWPRPGTTSSGASIPVAVFPFSSTVARNLMASSMTPGVMTRPPR